MSGLRNVVICACAVTMIFVHTTRAQDTKQGQETPAAQSQGVTELNTVLMESTFRIEGRNAQNQPTLGTAFVMGRPFPSGVPTMSGRGRYVLITAAHVLQDMQGDTAVLHLRQKVNETDW